MSRKFITKVIAGAAFGGASLLIAMPGMAVADDPHHDRDHKKPVEGWVYAYPDHTKAGKTVHIVQICKDPVEFPTVESEITGVVPLEPGTDPDKIFDRDGKHHKKHDKKHDKKHHKKDGKKHHKVLPLEELEDADALEELEDGKKHHRDKGKHHEDPKDPKHHKKHHKKHDKKHDKFKKHDKDHPWAYFADVEIPKDAEPGKYTLTGDCGEGKLIVVPSGWVDGGDGGALGTTTSTGLLAGGAGMLAAAALGGTALLRRRTADGSLA